MKTPPLTNPLPQELSQGIQDLSLGRTNASGTFTCTANAASTVVTDARVQVGDYIIAFPRTANAASAIASLFIAAATVVGQFTVTHANNANADKTHAYLIVSPQEVTL